MRVCITAYKIEKNKGSEDGSGYNIVLGLASKINDLTIITRINNANLLRNDPQFRHVNVIGMDVPKYLAFYKKGSRGIILYYYIWQIIAGNIISKLHKKYKFDLVHNLNFHADWSPFFFKGNYKKIWGPIAHHRSLPLSFWKFTAFNPLIKDWARTFFKYCFWNFDLNLKKSISASDIIFFANNDLPSSFKSAIDKVRFQHYAGSAFENECCASKMDTFTVLYVGRLVPLKGCQLLVPSFNQFLNLISNYDSKFANCKLQIIGSGECKEQIKNQIKHYGLSENVRLIDWIEQSHLIDFYKSSSIFLYPSVEAQGLVVSEAMSFGLPVIAIQDTGPGFLTGNTELNLQLNNISPTTIADKLFQYYIKSDTKKNELSRLFKHRYENELSWNAITTNIFKVYCETISVKGVEE